MAAGDPAKDPKRFGPYELLEKVGVGGMGSVFKARRTDTEDIIALKVAHRLVANDSVLSQRFHNEFKIASQLKHPFLVRALGHGVENGTPFLVLEFVDGPSLDKHLRERGPLPVDQALAIFGNVAEALAFIHDSNLIHRDIKPGNILIGKDGQAKLADLGLIKDLESQNFLTHSRTGLGTLEYAAPEQFDDAKNVDLRCDIYSLAASLYVALTGRFPFGHGGQMRVLTSKLAHQLTPLSHLVEHITASLDHVVTRSLHPDPEVRPASIREFLEGLRGTLPVSDVPQPKPPVDTPAKVQERRGKIRHATSLATTFGMLSPSRESWTANIMDISAGGVCLQIPRRFEPNTLLQVFLPDEAAGEPAPRLVRTCWIKPLPDQTWLLGCLFVNPLEAEDLDRFLLRDLSQTNMLDAEDKDDEAG